MARTTGRLTALKVQRAKTPGMYADGGGLYLQVAKGGASWIYRYMLNKRAREMGLGPLALFGLSEARAKALDARRLRHEGIDPIEARKAERTRARLDAAKATTAAARATARTRGFRTALAAATKHAGACGGAMARPTEQEIIDAIVRDATSGMFTGDQRDGDAPPITRENFFTEMYRHGAKALRSRLSRLSRDELDAELNAAATHVERLHGLQKEAITLVEHDERMTIRKRQAELGRRHTLQPAILAAARYYRAKNKNAKEAWLAIERQPHKTNDGATVMIECDKVCAKSQDGTQKRMGVKFNQWQKSYWPAAKP
jgi:Arm DNA-binding domain